MWPLNETPPSLVELAGSLAAGETTSTAVTRSCLDRIEAWQPRINAFITIDAEGAMAAAEAADKSRAAGDAGGPLHGVPLAHKDMFWRAGRRASGGSRMLGELEAPETAAVIERLDAAGAIALGSLNMSEFAAGPTGHNAHYGPCRNPWNPAHITGGSSSGSGASVAAGLAFGALGSDTGGSVRLPAAMCGVAGLKPTWGRVSRHGTMPRAWSLDCIGPLAHTVADCALLLSVVAGHDPRDPTSSRLPVPDADAMLARPVAGTRIGIAARAFDTDVHPAVQAALDESIEVFRRLGAEIVPVGLPDPATLFALADAISKCEAAAAHGRWMRERPQDYSIHVRSRTEAGLFIPATTYLESLAIRGRIVEQFVGEVFGKVDALHLPVLTFPVPTIAETDVDATAAIPDMVAGLTRATRPFNYLGLPALSVPCGFDGNGCPIAFQLIGRPFAEPRLLSLGHAYQGQTDWHRRRPALA